MNILVSCNEKYLELARYMLFSLRVHNNRLNVYLIHENVSNEAISDLKLFFDMYDIGNLEIIKFDSSKIELPLKDDEVTGHITKEAYFRLYAPYFLPEDMDRILYLDCDIICVDNIKEFYNTDFKDNILCGCPNADIANDEYIDRLQLSKGSIYINSGVLLFDLKKYREYVSMEKINRFITENASILHFQDQDVVNKLFFSKIMYCDMKYNFQIGMLLYNEGGKLIHYTGPIKPWFDDYNRLTLAQPYYDILLRLGEVKRLKYKRNKHISNFKKSIKLISIIVLGDKINEASINNVLSQLENRLEIIISYNTIDNDLINKYCEQDCRVRFIKNEELENGSIKQLGLYSARFDISDFENMNANFIRETVHFADIEQLPVVFYKDFESCNDKIIIDFGHVITPSEISELIEEKSVNGYKYMYLIDVSQNKNCKYGCLGNIK